jgi:hypothetical protein
MTCLTTRTEAGMILVIGLIWLGMSQAGGDKG